MSAIVQSIESFAFQFGYLGVFVISIAGSVVPFLPLPYLVVVVALSGTLNPLLLGLVAGVGGALGDVSSYVLGRLGYIAAGGATQGNLDVLHRLLLKYGALGVFIFSVTPLPDDVYAIPMGMVKLPFWRFFVANLAGKILLAVGVAYLGEAYISSVDQVMGGSALAISVAVVATGLISLLIVKADWVLAIEVAQKRGLRGVLTDLPEVLGLRKRRDGRQG